MGHAFGAIFVTLTNSHRHANRGLISMADMQFEGVRMCLFSFFGIIMSLFFKNPLYYLLVFDLNLDKMSKILSHMYVNRSRVYATTMQRTRPVHHCCWRMWQCTKSITLETRAFCNTDMHKTQQIGTQTCTMPSMYHVDMQLFSECIMDMKLWMV